MQTIFKQYPPVKFQLNSLSCANSLCERHGYCLKPSWHDLEFNRLIFELYYDHSFGFALTVVDIWSREYLEQWISIFLTTFAFEDVAMALSVGLVGSQKMTFLSAFMACFLGISIGDIGLYFLGRWASELNLEKHEIRFNSENKTTWIDQWYKLLIKLKKYRPDKTAESYISYSVVLSRFVPGTRIPAYVGAGLLKYSFFKFFVLTILSVAFWVLFVLLGGQSLYKLFSGNIVLVLIGLLFLLYFSKNIFPKLIDYWQRRALLHSWRKWTRFEFWPAWLFYAPIVPIYIFRSLVGRSFTLPFYSNPQILNSGLMGESKWDFLKHLDNKDASTLNTKLLDQTLSIEDIKNIIRENGFSFPFILKPDVGQRGYGVRIIRTDSELDDYLKLTRGYNNNQKTKEKKNTNTNLTLVLQKLSLFPFEAGIFYYRYPSEKSGHIFSITDKKFPAIVGDGISRLGDLILKDKRARIIAPIYFERFEDLNFVVPKNEEIIISECGNHCQGAIFENGANLNSDMLYERLDGIAKKIPDFYFGRFDIRYLDADSLRQGQGFEIVEVNGAGSEATHIWDKHTSIIEAYAVLWKQWKILFEIGLEIKHQIKSKTRLKTNVKVWLFLKEVFRVVFRKDKISISS